MKTPNEIAWNLFTLHSETPSHSFITLDEIAEITGLTYGEVDMLFEKRKIVHEIRKAIDILPKRLEGVKEIINEMENNKPHYEIDIEGIEQNDKSTD